MKNKLIIINKKFILKGEVYLKIINNLFFKLIHKVLFEFYFSEYWRYKRIPLIYNMEWFSDKQKQFVTSEVEKYEGKINKLNNWLNSHLK
jgi:hypothetical protein